MYRSLLPNPFLLLSQEELEEFPLPTVQHCQTVLNQMRYSSILLLVCQDSEQHKPDIHFFNCDEVEVSRAFLAIGMGWEMELLWPPRIFLGHVKWRNLR